jgi:hypothetical protein
VQQIHRVLCERYLFDLVGFGFRPVTAQVHEPLSSDKSVDFFQSKESTKSAVLAILFGRWDGLALRSDASR